MTKKTLFELTATSECCGRRCHASSELRSFWRLGSESYAENQLRRLAIPAGEHTLKRLPSMIALPCLPQDISQS